MNLEQSKALIYQLTEFDSSIDIREDLLKFLETLEPITLGKVLRSLQDLSAMLVYLKPMDSNGNIRTAVHAASMIMEWLRLGAEQHIKQGIITDVKDPVKLILSVLNSGTMFPTISKEIAEKSKEKEKEVTMTNMLKNFQTDTIN